MRRGPDVPLRWPYRPRLARGRGARPGPARSPLPVLFRGWLVVAGAFLVMLVGFGAAYSYAAIAVALEAEFGASRTAVSMVYALCGFSTFTSSALTGPLADRIGPRPVAIIGMMLVGFGLMTAATARTLMEIYLCFGLVIGIGIGFAYVPALAAVQRWFVTWRGLASGLATAGIGFGTALVPAATGALAATTDWRVALLAAGAAAIPLGVVGALLLSSSPESRGMLPDGVAAGRDRPVPGAPLDGAAFPAVLRERGFWLLYAGTLLVSLPVALPFAHLAQTAQDAGLSATQALSLLGIVGIASIAGRCACGAVADEIGRPLAFIACCAAIALLMPVWAFARTEQGFFGYAVGFGVAYGGFVALLPAFATDRFGRRAASSIIGMLYTSRGIALLAGAPLMAALLDWTGGRAVPLVGAALVGAIGAALMACAGLARIPVPSCGEAVPRDAQAAPGATVPPPGVGPRSELISFQ